MNIKKSDKKHHLFNESVLKYIDEELEKIRKKLHHLTKHDKFETREIIELKDKYEQLNQKKSNIQKGDE